MHLLAVIRPQSDLDLVVDRAGCGSGLECFLVLLEALVQIRAGERLDQALAQAVHVLVHLLTHLKKCSTILFPKIIEWKLSCYLVVKLVLFSSADCVPTPSTGQPSACWAHVD